MNHDFESSLKWSLIDAYILPKQNRLPMPSSFRALLKVKGNMLMVQTSGINSPVDMGFHIPLFTTG